MPKLFGNIELARFVEKMAATDDVAYVIAMKKLFPKKTFDVFEFEGGASCYAGNSPFSNTHGFGTDSFNHKDSLLSELEHFFDKQKCPTVLSVVSVCESKPMRLLSDRNYCPIGYRNVFIFDIDQGPGDTQINRGIKIVEAVSAEQKDIWLRVVSSGFADRELTEPDLISQGQSVKVGNRRPETQTRTNSKLSLRALFGSQILSV